MLPAIDLNFEIGNKGARSQDTTKSKLLNELLFDVPAKTENSAEISLTMEMIKRRLIKLSKNKNLE